MYILGSRDGFLEAREDVFHESAERFNDELFLCRFSLASTTGDGEHRESRRKTGTYQYQQPNGCSCSYS